MAIVLGVARPRHRPAIAIATVRVAAAVLAGVPAGAALEGAVLVGAVLVAAAWLAADRVADQAGVVGRVAVAAVPERAAGPAAPVRGVDPAEAVLAGAVRVAPVVLASGRDRRAAAVDRAAMAALAVVPAAPTVVLAIAAPQDQALRPADRSVTPRAGRSAEEQGALCVGTWRAP